MCSLHFYNIQKIQIQLAIAASKISRNSKVT